MGIQCSGNIDVSGDPAKVFEFIQKYDSLPYGFSPWENGGYDAVSRFEFKNDFQSEYWQTASKEFPDLKFSVRYQLEMISAHKIVIVGGKILMFNSFNWDDGSLHTWSE